MNISEVAAKFEITPATLRYYEKEGLVPPVNRSTSGIRDYNEEDLGWVEFIKCMRNAGLSIESLARYTELYKSGEETLAERKTILVEEYQKLLEKQQAINETVNRLEYKLEIYDVQITDYESKCLGKSQEAAS